VPLEKLQSHFFLEVMFGKQLKDVDHLYVQLSRDMVTITESTGLYENKRAMPRAEQGDFLEVSLTEIVEPAQGEAGVVCPQENLPDVHEILNPEEQEGFGHSCIPFFYPASEKEE
jgi:hypothetical protein